MRCTPDWCQSNCRSPKRQKMKPPDKPEISASQKVTSQAGQPPTNATAGGASHGAREASHGAIGNSQSDTTLDKHVVNQSRQTEAVEGSSATEFDRPPVQTSTAAESRLDGWTWLGRVGIKSAAVLTVGALLLLLLGVAQRTGWLTANGVSSATSKAGSEHSPSGRPTLYLSHDVYTSFVRTWCCPCARWNWWRPQLLAAAMEFRSPLRPRPDA